MATMATPIRSPKGGVLRFYGRGGRQVLRAEPQGDGWSWLDGEAGVGIAAVGRPAGRLHDVDLQVVARLDATTLRCRAGTWPVDVDRRTVGAGRDPAIAVDVDDGVMIVRHHDAVDRRVAVLAALVLPPPNPYTRPTPCGWNDPIRPDDPVVRAAEGVVALGGLIRIFLG